MIYLSEYSRSISIADANEMYRIDWGVSKKQNPHEQSLF